jgi:hypothetical protein
MFMKFFDLIKKYRRRFVLYNIFAFTLLSTGIIFDGIWNYTASFFKERQERAEKQRYEIDDKAARARMERMRQEATRTKDPNETVLSSPVAIDQISELYLILSRKFDSMNTFQVPYQPLDIPDIKEIYARYNQDPAGMVAYHPVLFGVFGAERNVILYSGKSNTSTVLFKHPTFVSAIYKGTVFGSKQLIVFQATSDTNHDSKMSFEDCQDVVFYETNSLRATTFHFPNLTVLNFREIDPGRKFLIAVRDCMPGQPFSEMRYKIFDFQKKTLENLLSAQDQKMLTEQIKPNR